MNGGEECRAGIQLLGTSRASIVNRPCINPHCMPVVSIPNQIRQFCCTAGLLVARSTYSPENALPGGKLEIELVTSSLLNLVNALLVKR
jgi:hypothetical protein